MLYDGSPAYPDLDRLWDFAADAGITCFGTSAAYIARVHEGRVSSPAVGRDLCRAARASARRARRSRPRGSAGSTTSVGTDTWLFSTSGGTDVVHRVRRRRADAARLRGRAAGAARSARRSRRSTRTAGRSSTRSASSSSPSRCRRCRSSSGATTTARATARATSRLYPGVWRHGDWIEITARGTAIIYGRSDSTINRGGVRMGTSEIYRAVARAARDRRRARRRRPARGRDELAAALRRARATAPSSTTTSCARSNARSARTARRATSPTRSIAVDAVPRTLSGKIARGPGQAHPHGRRAREGVQAATRSRTPRRSTGSPSWRRAAGESPRRGGGGRDRGGRAAA